MSEIDIDALMANISKEPEIAEAGPEDEVQESHQTDENSDDAKEEHRSDDPIARLAEKMGWNPNFKGSDRVSAEEYIERTHKFLRESSERQKALREQIRKQGEQIVRIQHEQYEEKQRLAKVKHRDAVRDGDHRSADEAIEVLKAAPPETVKFDDEIDSGSPDPYAQIPAQVRSTVEGWIGENQWFRTDAAARRVANALYEAEMLELGVDDPKTILPRVTEGVRKLFPQHWNTPESEQQPEPEKRPAPPAVNGTPRRAGTIVRSSAPARGWNDMPAELRLLASQVIDDGGFRPDLKTLPERRAAYAAAYFAQEQR